MIHKNKYLKRKIALGMAAILATGSMSFTSQAAPLDALDPYFDATFYAAENPDVTDAIGTDEATLLHHFLTYGYGEGRMIDPLFNVQAYMDNNPDLAEAFGDDISLYYLHFFHYGVHEDRYSGALFDAAQYAQMNPDVVAAVGTDPLALYQHFEEHGLQEGRAATAFNFAAIAADPVLRQSFERYENALASSNVLGAQRDTILQELNTDLEQAVSSGGSTHHSSNNNNSGSESNVSRLNLPKYEFIFNIQDSDLYYAYTYDETGNPIQKIAYQDMSPGATLIYDYKADRLPIGCSVYRENRETRELEQTGYLTYTYDDLGNLIRETATESNSAIANYNYCEYLYDQNGRKVQETIYSKGSLSSSTTYTYDSSGNICSVSGYYIDGDGDKISGTYTCKYDTNNNCIQIIFDCPQDTSENYMCNYEYDSEGTMSKIFYTHYDQGTIKKLEEFNFKDNTTTTTDYYPNGSIRTIEVINGSDGNDVINFTIFVYHKDDSSDVQNYDNCELYTTNDGSFVVRKSNETGQIEKEIFVDSDGFFLSTNDYIYSGSNLNNWVYYIHTDADGTKTYFDHDGPIPGPILLPVVNSMMSIPLPNANSVESNKQITTATVSDNNLGSSSKEDGDTDALTISGNDLP